MKAKCCSWFDKFITYLITEEFSTSRTLNMSFRLNYKISLVHYYTILPY